MRKWPWIILVVLVLWLLPVGVLADSSQDVVVTAVGWICGAPGGFTITYVSDYEVQLSWVKGDGAENTMVRAAIGRVPIDRTDGMEIYYGDGTTASSWINMETLSDPVCYRAWSQNAGGIWSSLFVEDQIEGVGMITIGLIVLALGITGIAVWRKQLLLYMVAAIGCLIIAVYLTGSSTGASLIFGIPIYLISGYMFWEFVTWWF